MESYLPNPSNKMDFYKGCAAAIFLILIGIIASFFVKNGWVSIVAFLGVSFIPFFLGWERQYIVRPHHVEIYDDRVIFHLRYGKGAKIVPYELIRWIAVLDQDPSTAKGPADPDGYIGLGNKMKDIHPVVWPLAIKIREAYMMRMGAYPPRHNPEWEMKT